MASTCISLTHHNKSQTTTTKIIVLLTWATVTLCAYQSTAHRLNEREMNEWNQKTKAMTHTYMHTEALSTYKNPSKQTQQTCRKRWNTKQWNGRINKYYPGLTNHHDISQANRTNVLDVYNILQIISYRTIFTFLIRLAWCLLACFD